MRTQTVLCAAAAALYLAAPTAYIAQSTGAASSERHLKHIRQLTRGGENAEAYFSSDGQRLVFQSTREGVPCDQIFTMSIDGSDERRVSTGTGRTTCGYFYPGASDLLFASTHETAAACPPKPSFARGYVWPIYDGYEIYRATAAGGLTRLTTSPGYDAEATIAPDGVITFTSVRDGDMEIYSMNQDGSGVRRLTHRPGPDGGPFFSWDGTRIAFRGRSFTPGAEMDDYRALLKQALWRPTELELFVMDRDGANVRQVTKLGGANFAPSWHPDGKRLIFASNAADPKGRNFDLYLVNLDGTGVERVTFNETFDGFPMFSPDGKRLVFASNRQARTEGETNVFIADWVD
ncbi:MAG: PD40 domain-containing protein [Acidobacteria bacterium]|nr:PD40 domain-containing protein [Acidobacteriota bacterium]